MEFQKKYGKILGIIAIILFALATALFLPNCVARIYYIIKALVMGYFSQTWMDQLRLVIDDILMLAGLLSFAGYGLIYLKNRKHSPLLAICGAIMVVQRLAFVLFYTVVMLINGILFYDIGTFFAILFAEIIRVIPVLLFAFVAVFSYIRLKGLWCPIVATALAMLALAGDSLIVAATVFTRALNGVAFEGVISMLISGSNFLSGAALYIGVIILSFISLYYPKRKRPEQEDPEPLPIDALEEAPAEQEEAPAEQKEQAPAPAEIQS